MTNAAFSASADVLDDAHYKAVITQTGEDTCSLYVEKWALGSNYDGPAESSSNYALINCRTEGQKVTAYVHEPFIEPHLELDVAPPSAIPSLTLKITNALWANETLVLPISEADLAGAQRFIADAQFPLGTAN